MMTLYIKVVTRIYKACNPPPLAINAQINLEVAILIGFQIVQPEPKFM